MDRRKPEGNLRKGWTTGTCAAAAATGALEALITGRFPTKVTVQLPRGETPTLALSRKDLTADSAFSSVIKDAGDDPDVTHGAEIITEVSAGPIGSGITFRAGEGVGTVTLPGLPLAVGEPAINPVPRKIITENLEAVAVRLGGTTDLIVTISIPGGTALAKKTMNGRLGIKGGLSILGTTGIVIPYSCASWIHSIHRGIDVAQAAGLTHIAAATGSTSESAVQKRYALPEKALIDMGDFAGGVLKYLRARPIECLTIAGGFAKLVKLAQGHMDLHSSRSSVDFSRLAGMAVEIGADPSIATVINASNTAMAALDTCRAAELPIASRVALGAREVALAALSGETSVEVVVYDRAGNEVGNAS